MTNFSNDLDSARLLLAAGHEVVGRLQAAFDLSGEQYTGVSFYTRSRVKDINSLREKIYDRQRRLKSSYSLDNVTDIVGFRIVTLYDDQLASAYKCVRDVLQSCSTQIHPLVQGNSFYRIVTEIGVFPRSLRKDDPYQEIARAISEEIIAEGLSPDDIMKIERDNRYSSLHILFYANSYSQGNTVRVPVEIQIRTAIDDVWAEISHKNDYKIKNRFVWNKELEELYSANSNFVDQAKEQFDAVTTVIRTVRRNKDRISKEIDSFRKPLRHSTGSFSIDLMSALASRHIDRQHFQAVDTYISQARLLVRARGNNINARLSTELALDKLLVLVVDSLKEQGDQRSIRNIQFLAKFEKQRLRFIAVKNSDMEEDKKRSYFRRIFLDIESSMHAPEVDISPSAVLHYWLFLAAREVPNGFPERPERYLADALSALATDLTVPEDSVIRRVIPRQAAIFNWSACEMLLLEHGYLVGNKPAVIGKAKSYVMECLRLSLDPQAVTLVRPDLRHEISENEAYIDLCNRILYAGAAYLYGLEEGTLKSMGYGRASLQADLGLVESRRSAFFKRINGEVSSDIEDLHSLRIDHALALAYELFDIGLSRNYYDQIEKMMHRGIGANLSITSRIRYDIERFRNGNRFGF